MKVRLVIYAKARLKFREILVEFANELGDSDVLFTNIYHGPLPTGKHIYISEHQSIVPGNSRDGVLHSLSFQYSSFEERSRAMKIAKQFENYILSLAGKSFQLGGFTIEFSSTFVGEISVAPETMGPIFTLSSTYDIF